MIIVFWCGLVVNMGNVCVVGELLVVDDVGMLVLFILCNIFMISGIMMDWLWYWYWVFIVVVYLSVYIFIFIVLFFCLINVLFNIEVNWLIWVR